MMKQGLIDKVAIKAGISQRQARLVVNAVFDSMSEALEHGESVGVSGFGTFEVRDRSSRRGRNAITGESVEIEAKKAPFFKASNMLKKRIANSGL